MAITQTVDIPDSRRLTLDVPQEVPVGPTVLTFTPAASVPGLDPRLRDAVDPAMYGKGEISDDIIGPFYDAWEHGN